jgi:hypothetical protein
LSPEVVEEECGLCGVRFPVESVIAWSERAEMVCPECVRYLGERNPARFPCLADYRVAIEGYPEPIWPSVEEILRVEAEDPHAIGAAYAASYIR